MYLEQHHVPYLSYTLVHAHLTPIQGCFISSKALFQQVIALFTICMYLFVLLRT